MESLRSSLGVKDKIRADIKSCIKAFQSVKQKIIKPTQDAYGKPRKVCIFKSWVNYEVWTFCAYHRMSYIDWINHHCGLHESDPDNVWLEEPQRHELNRQGDISNDLYDQYVHRVMIDKKEKKDCKICFNSGWAYLLKNVVEFNNIPGEMIRAECWCRR